LIKKKISKDWLNKHRKDQFFKESKMRGFRSRSSFKLIEMNEKFNFINKDTNLLDLGSSPGGWSQVASKKIKSGKILAVDIIPMEKINNVSFVNGSILDVTTNEKIKMFFGKKIDVVISDMAANTTGNKNLDSYKTGELCIEAMDLAQKVLREDGVFLSKIFMGSIFSEIIKKAGKYFKKVVKFKPLSSKRESKEIYIYCRGIVKSFNLPKV
tara:strand:+ start:1932 stop:2567 length:636 start_codon:yes stop_codon:yes gene_type:complete